MGYFDDILEHHGILGQKWGVRRFQNKNGTLTATGKSRYSNGQVSKKAQSKNSSKDGADQEQQTKKFNKKKALAIGAAVIGTGLAAYGGYKLNQLNKQSQARSTAISNATKALNEFKSLQSNTSKPTISKSTAQNANKVVSQMTSQKLQSVQQTYNAGRTAVNTLTKVAGQQKFSQASKVNDDFVNELLKKNASMLAGF